MATLTQTPPSSAAGHRRRVFNRQEYHAMGHAGILPSAERVELLAGEVIVMSHG